jgi:hypothetical protein
MFQVGALIVDLVFWYYIEDEFPDTYCSGLSEYTADDQTKQ